MVNRSAAWFRTVSLGGAAVAFAAVLGMELLQEAHLTSWLHIPLTLVALGSISLGAAVAGVACVEHRARMSPDRAP